MKERFMKRFSILMVLCTLVTSVVLPESTAGDENKNIQQEEIGYNWEEENYIEKEEGLIPEDSILFQYVEQEKFDKKNHSFRMENEEHLDTYVFQNEDGTKTVYYMNEKVKYIDEDGNTREKDIRLVKKEKGFGIGQNEVELFLPENPIEGVDVEFSGYTVTLIPQSENGQAVAEMVGNSIVYDEFFDENSYLKYTPILAGIKEDIVLESYAENVSYDFLLETDGLYLYNDDKGYYLADVAKEEAIFDLGQVIVYDAIGKPCMGTMEVSTVEEGKKYMLTLSVSDEFLTDPTTEYPVTIDPTITISDNETGTGSILDAPIFKGYPSKNYGNYYYNSVGTTSSAYGIGRTVVKLPGLYNSEEYLSISDADQIQSVIFGAKDATGGSSQRIYLYPLTENTTWTESNVTWNNVGAYSTALSYSASLKYGQVTEYDITEFAKAWINGEYSATAGFIMINKDESRNRSFCSSEHSTTDYRPYVEMTYTPKISLNSYRMSISEGGSANLILTTNADGLPASWSSNNTTVATVSSTGKVTAKKAGTAIITATITDEDGTSYTASCTVYTYVPNGVYYIQNMNSGYYLHLSGGRVKEATNVIQYSKYSSTSEDRYRIRQMWKVCYLGEGTYCIRPVQNGAMGLYWASYLVTRTIGTSNYMSSIASYAEWTIEWDSTGYVFKNQGLDSRTMQVAGASKTSGVGLTAASYDDSDNCRWTLSQINSVPSGVLLYNNSTGALLASNLARSVAIDQTKTLSDLDIKAVPYSGSIYTQTYTVSWSMPSGQTTASIVGSTGAVTGAEEGSVKVTASCTIDGVKKEIIYQLFVIPFKDGTYFIKNRQYGGYLQIDDAYKTNSTAGTSMEHGGFNAGNYQKWILTSLDNGYYKIVSAESGLVVCVSSSQTSGQDVSLIQEAYTGANRQQWKLAQAGDGSYKLSLRSSENLSSELVMAVGDNSSSDYDGVSVEQRVYTDDTIYQDEWELFLFGENRYKLLAYIGDSQERKDYITKVSPLITTYLGNDIYTHSYRTVEKDDMKRLMCDSDIFIVHTHGEEFAFYTSSSDFLSMDDIYDLNLSNMKFALLLTCYSGKDYNESNITNNHPVNMIERMVCNGAETVVGFNVETYPKDCNEFADNFLKYALKDGKSVAEAIDSATNTAYTYGLEREDVVIGGNVDLYLNE